MLAGTNDSGAIDWCHDASIAELVRRKAIQLSRARGFTRSDRPDIEQELRIELLRKAARFDPTRGQTAAYANQVIENRAASLARLVRAKKRLCGVGTVSLSTPICNANGRSIELGNTLSETVARRHIGQRRKSDVEYAQLRLDVAATNRELEPALRDLAALMGLISHSAAAGVLGISRRQAAGRLAQLRDHYEQRGMKV